MTISNWPLAERPREKCLSHGAKYLSDAELLAIFLRTGIRGKTALDLARDLLSEFGGLKKLLSATSSSLCQKPGIGKAKYAMLQAGLELGRRYVEEQILPGEKFVNSQSTKRFLTNRLRDYPHEVFACLFLNTQNQLIDFEELFHGTLHEANIYPREIIKRCLAHNAAKIIFSHNHPSGNPTPSQSDREMTQSLKEALQLIDVQVIDHIVVGYRECVSFAELGLL